MAISASRLRHHADPARRRARRPRANRHEGKEHHHSATASTVVLNIRRGKPAADAMVGIAIEIGHRVRPRATPPISEIIRL